MIHRCAALIDLLIVSLDVTPIPYDRAKYRWRNLAESLFSKLKNWRLVATRYDRSAESCLGFVALASVKLWLSFVHHA